MDTDQRRRLIRQRAVAKPSLTRLQKFVETGDRKVVERQVRNEELPNIFNKFEIAQTELETTDDGDHSKGREQYEEQYYQVKSRFSELLHPVNIHSSPDNSSEQGSSSSTHSTHTGSSQIRLPTIEIPCFDGNVCKWLHYKDTFEALIVNNKSLSNVQKFHYLTSSLKGEAKTLIANLQITNDNFVVAWDLVT
jgi:hypothetical protein